jgi:hypothetical protein
LREIGVGLKEKRDWREKRDGGRKNIDGGRKNCDKGR